MAEHVSVSKISNFIGQEIVLKGWVYNRTDKGKLQFLQLRDGTGLVQAVAFGKDLPEADFFVLATVHNRRQARAIRDAIRLALKAEGAGVPRFASEDPEGRWSLYDYGGVVVHLFDDEGREHFGLDERWEGVPELRARIRSLRERLYF